MILTPATAKASEQFVECRTIDRNPLRPYVVFAMGIAKQHVERVVHRNGYNLGIDQWQRPTIGNFANLMSRKPEQRRKLPIRKKWAVGCGAQYFAHDLAFGLAKSFKVHVSGAVFAYRLTRIRKRAIRCQEL